jgi:hypothetical protein
MRRRIDPIRPGGPQKGRITRLSNRLASGAEEHRCKCVHAAIPSRWLIHLPVSVASSRNRAAAANAESHPERFSRPNSYAGLGQGRTGFQPVLEHMQGGTLFGAPQKRQRTRILVHFLPRSRQAGSQLCSAWAAADRNAADGKPSRSSPVCKLYFVRSSGPLAAWRTTF